MSSSVGILLFIVAILVTILIHEAAHFGFAKAFGIKVQEFFVGFGPRVWSVRRGETEYGLKAIPAGGDVRIAGMNPFQPARPEDLSRTFGAKPVWQRALVIAAGPATHFVLAFVFFALWLGIVGQPVLHSPLVASVAPRLAGAPSPAAEVGLRVGDRIVRGGPKDGEVGGLLEPFLHLRSRQRFHRPFDPAAPPAVRRRPPRRPGGREDP